LRQLTEQLRAVQWLGWILILELRSHQIEELLLTQAVTRFFCVITFLRGVSAARIDDL
jgi:hypothetical protein